MITRPLPDRTPADAARLTEDQQALLEERQGLIRQTVLRVLRDDPVATFALQGVPHSRGWAGRQRLLGFAKLALADGGRSLLSATLWRQIEYELSVPWEVHYWEMLVGDALHHSLALHAAAIPTPDYRTTFFRSVAPGHQTREQLQYSQGHWLPALVPGMPSLENVTEDEALHFLGHVGVALDAEHPATPPAHPTLALDDETISVPTGGLSGNVMMFAYGGMGPYRYEVISGSLGGVVHIGSNSGVVLVMTESDTAVGETVAIVRVVDANGDTEDATLTVTVTALPQG